MKLTIDREDLKPEYRDTNCSRTRFEYFTLQVQQAIRKAGRAIFWDDDRRSYNAIYPPRNRFSH